MEEELTPEEEVEKLRQEVKKLRREVRHVMKDNALLRVANEQAAHTQAYIQRDNMRQIFFIGQLLKSSSNVMILTDDEMKTVMASEKYFEISEQSRESIRGGILLEDAFRGVMDDEHLTEFIEKCEDALNGNAIKPYIMHREYQQRHVDMQTTIRAMIRDNGTVAGLNIQFVDMTEIIDARDKADEANRAKSSFLANMSHEIRTPINAVLGMDEMILRESKEPDTIGYAEDIQAAGKTLLALINEILDFSKVEEGKMEIIPTQYDLGSLINDMINMIRERVEKKGLRFDIEIDERIPYSLYGDEIRLKQCMLNLLVNAVKYTEKGSVKLGIGYTEKDSEHIFLDFHVSDTGIGMKKEDMEKLFSPFARIEEMRNRTIEGTGLGMSITQKLLNLMGTSLQVDSVYGKGSVFSFSVEQKVMGWDALGSYTERFHERASHETYREQFRAPEARILVVDDTDINLKVITRLLKRTQIQIDTAESGIDAIKMTQDHPDYDVVFIDHMMPEMDGIETLAAMKEQPGFDSMIHIALTANAISGAREMYLESGFDDYLSKPVEGEILEKMLIKYLPYDKVEKISDDEAEEEEEYHEKEEEAWIPDWLFDMPEIDIDEGVKNCGSEEFFLNVLGTFHDTAEQKGQEIRDLYAAEDWENYTIKVHAMKSSARIIGAAELSDRSLKLEMAGKDGDIDYIRANTDEMLTMLESLDEKLKKLNPDEEELVPISDAMLKDAYQSMYVFVQSMDFDTMESILNSLKEYKLPEEDEEIMRAVHDDLMQLDWDSIEDRINGRG